MWTTLRLGTWVTCGVVLAACARPSDGGKSPDAPTAPRASSIERVPPPPASNAAPPATTGATATATATAAAASSAIAAGVRYFRGDDAALARGWRGMTVSSSEMRILATETVRVVKITEMAVANGRTSFVANFDGRVTECSLEAERDAQRFTCFGDRQPFTLRELLAPTDNADMALMEQQIKDTTLPPSICDQAELCCKSIWPLFVPGEQCDVSFQLGGRFPETCLAALQGFRKMSELKKLALPATCR
jgi:hypothetical protein